MRKKQMSFSIVYLFFASIRSFYVVLQQMEQKIILVLFKFKFSGAILISIMAKKKRKKYCYQNKCIITNILWTLKKKKPAPAT